LRGRRTFSSGSQEAISEKKKRRGRQRERTRIFRSMFFLSPTFWAFCCFSFSPSASFFTTPCEKPLNPEFVFLDNFISLLRIRPSHAAKNPLTFSALASQLPLSFPSPRADAESRILPQEPVPLPSSSARNGAGGLDRPELQFFFPNAR
jgi:hypothetical protein